MTISAKICPPMSPCARAKATSARLAPLSMSSRQSRITSGLRRVSTPPAPMQKISAGTIRYQVRGTLLSLGRPAGLDHGLRRPGAGRDVRAPQHVGDRDLVRLGQARAPARQDDGA